MPAPAARTAAPTLARHPAATAVRVRTQRPACVYARAMRAAWLLLSFAVACGPAHPAAAPTATTSSHTNPPPAGDAATSSGTATPPGCPATFAAATGPCTARLA